MRISLTKILIVALIVVLSITIGNISTTIRVNLKLGSESEVTSKSTKSAIENDKRNISLSYDGLLWFLQISDIHISIFRDMDRVTDFEAFCKDTLDAIKPTVVLASGDLTDAKSIDTLGSKQYEDEWKLYRHALEKFNVAKKTTWLDVRGNHDNFNVPGPSAKENFYRNYSVQGGANPRSYLHSVRMANGQIVSFIALDACLEPGPKRPFNFFGLVNEHETEHLKKLIRKARSVGSQHSVWFGHYPTSCILSAEQGVRGLISSDTGAQAYLCGHLHTMGGLLPHMYTLQHAGFLELELADWKDSRKYRLCAIDHGLFSFVDVSHNDWPVVLVTNPKHALFHIPDREPVVSSTHIRVIAFSTSNIVTVKSKINNEEWKLCTHVKGPLFVGPWEPNMYSKGLHNIQIAVTDEAGRTKVVKQPFSLDGSTPSYDIAPRILLMTNITNVFQVLFGLSIVGCVVPLSLLRLLLARIRAGHKLFPTTSVGLLRCWYRRLWLLANLDHFYYPLIFYPLYITVGPWTVGEIIENHIGVIFAWGTFINSAYLPGSFTYGYGFFQMATYQFPLILALASKIDRSLKYSDGKDHGLMISNHLVQAERFPKMLYRAFAGILSFKRLNTTEEPRHSSKLLAVLYHWWADLPLYIITLLQLLFLYFFWLSYGSLAILLGPFRSWPVLATVCLWRRVHKTPARRVQELADIFHEANFNTLQRKMSHST